MLSVKFSVGSPLAYSVRSLKLPGLVHQVQADFQDGDHTFTSSKFKLGTIHSLGGRSLIGQLSFHYSYDSKNQVITISGTDFPSADGMTLITMPEGSEHACFEHAAPAGFDADEVYQNSTWNYHSQLMPGAAQVINSIARAASDALINALKLINGLTVQVRTPVPQLPMNDYLSLCVVYRNGEFLEVYDHNRDYETVDEVKPIDSVWGGTVTMSSGENFANVIGSSPDPKIGGLTWIKLWSNQFGTPTVCTSLNYKGFPCGSTLVGGHVITGQTAKVVAKGSNSVYIYPICKTHNNNDKVYMAALTNLNGVWLKNYLGP